ncbi:unnamed protein product, partial [Rotaria sp. Silwood2]
MSKTSHKGKDQTLKCLTQTDIRNFISSPNDKSITSITSSVTALSVNEVLVATTFSNESNHTAIVHTFECDSISRPDSNDTVIETYQEIHAVNQSQEDRYMEDAMEVDESNERISTSISGTQLQHNENLNYEIAVKVHCIESMLHQCAHLIKQSTATNVSHEEFVKSVYNYATKLVNSSNELLQLCSQRIDQLNKDRENISLVEPKTQTFIERDPGSYSAIYNYTFDERRYLVDIGPFQPTLSDFPKNSTMA